MFAKYYDGDYYGRSTASILYQLSSQLNRSSKDFLWFWIVGLSDLMIHSKSGEIEYNEEIEICNDEVFKLHPSEHNNQFQD
jgi:hypothetical protein